uniref:MARVEL domain-containing protein n=1 Tax=Angiostrongylus cantonensis TaxID=6313 RepID=A0A0K0DBU1_ANGCA
LTLPRRKCSLYSVSISSIIRAPHDQNTKQCSDYFFSRSTDVHTVPFQYFPILTAPLIALISLAWFVTNIFYTNTPCALAYNCMEMPSAVFCSLLAGISAVIEIHYSIDFNNLEWSQKWSWADSVALCFIHAVLAFALQ